MMKSKSEMEAEVMVRVRAGKTLFKTAEMQFDTRQTATVNLSILGGSRIPRMRPTWVFRRKSRQRGQFVCDVDGLID